MNPMVKKTSKKDPVNATPVLSSGASSITANKSLMPNPLTKLCTNVEQ